MSADRLTILAVDDERTPLDDLARLLRSCPSVQDVECAFDGHDALVKASACGYDAIFLDVRMPDLDGLELGRVLRAVRDAAPARVRQRVRRCSGRARSSSTRSITCANRSVDAGSRRRSSGSRRRSRPPSDRPPSGPIRQPGYVPDSDVVAVANVRSGSTRLIARSSILYAQSHGDFVRIVGEGGRYLLRGTLGEIERRWEPHGFVRVHRQYVVNLSRAVELRPLLGGTAELVFGDGQTIPIARRHVAELGRLLGV